MKKIVIVLLPVLILIVTGLLSCKNQKGSDNQEEFDIQEIEELTKEIEEAVYPLPTSVEVIKMLTELEVGYMIGVSNSTENVNNYVTNKSKAINLGIYGADLSYATLYNMDQDVINYLDVIRVLANGLNMPQLYSQELYDDIKTNYDDRDQLVNVLTNAFDGTFSFMNENDQQSQALMVVAGAWVEGMYITTHISESVFHVEGIVSVLLEQKKSFELYIDLATQHADDPAVKEILNMFEPMKKVYEGIDTSLTEKNVKDITREVALIREKLIS